MTINTRGKLFARGNQPIQPMLRSTITTGAAPGSTGVTSGSSGAAPGSPGAASGSSGAAPGSPGAASGPPGAAPSSSVIML
jgi:hypothetical protein